MVYGGKPSTGCQNCRKRRIKCDETRPHCKACVRTGRSCPGYPHPLDVVLRDQVAFRRKKRDTSSAVSTPGAVSNQSSPAVVASNDALSNSSSNASSPSGPLLPAQSVPRALFLSIEDTVTSMFFNSFIYSPRDPLILQGFMDILPDVFIYAQPGSPLHVSTLAVSFFSVSAWTGNRAFLQSAEQLFVKALAKTRKALQGDISRNVDDILMAILLLSTYEEFCAMKEGRYPTRTHLRGAVALVNSKSPAQRSSILSLTLETAVQVQLVKSSKGLPYPTMATPTVWRTAPAAPQTATTQLWMATSELASLRQAWDQFNYANAYHIKEVEELLARAIRLDAQLEAWTYALPTHWKPVPATSIPPSVRQAGMYKNRCDCYTDMWVAGTWNFYRDSRIVVQNIIRCCLELLPGSTSEQIQASVEMIYRLSLDMCGTVPYILGSQTMSVHVGQEKIEYPEADGRRVTAAHHQTAALIGGWVVSCHLSNLQLFCRDAELNAWAGVQKERVLRIYTFGGNLHSAASAASAAS
ncbi:C6 zinc finger domain protein [Aspergillus ibericus CBS 121593]|uniref:C6 zinc finger domain protein n=1 Tax=Aspergillus ibericus CBS 121593 TaxID=1448316 RepID=A0A395H5Q7_9EURO|nr:C6 zinc finger domain protein [Aspergillus ibericus CBS 121593]RAL02839.1 C6 zinc finger domain protein [Aspergillus ibericus CBS 121593]